MPSAFDWGGVLTAATTLFFVMDPLGNLPIFNSILKDFEPRRRVRIIARELMFALVILLGFLLLGNRILAFLGLEQSSISIAGGILLFLIALRMVFPLRQQAFADEYDSDPFIVPLAMPLVAGPSAIAMLLLLSSTEPARIVEWITALILAWAMTTAILLASPVLLRALGHRGLRALERLMGMLLILVAVQLLLDGLADWLKS